MADGEETRIAVAVATLADQDVRMAAGARTALEWIVGDQGLSLVTQERIQNFCWYDLPVSWVVAFEEQVSIAEALARALDLLELHRYAAICRSKTTRNILEAYEISLAKGLAAFRRASAMSGITPPDLPEFEWGEAMGFSEVSAWWSISGSLELAVMAGDLVPGSPGWRTRQREITRGRLNTPQLEFLGQTPAELITTERTGAWLNVWCSQTRREVLSRTCDRLTYPVRLPAQSAADPVPRLRWLLEQMDEGIGLTRAGNLNLAFVRRNAGRFGWKFTRSPRSETEVADLRGLRKFATRLRLWRRTGQSTLLSAKGRRLLTAPQQLWRATAAGLLWGSDFNIYIGELFLGLMLDDHSRAETDIRRVIAEAVREEDFRERFTGESPGELDVARAVGEAGNLCRCLGLFAETGGHRSFTDSGRATALEALRIRATGPRAIPRYG